jgi:hypothetical protein
LKCSWAPNASGGTVPSRVSRSGGRGRRGTVPQQVGTTEKEGSRLPSLDWREQLAALCLTHHPTLRRRLAAVVNTTPENLEEACVFARMQLLTHGLDESDAVGAWLLTVARREAIKHVAATRSLPGRRQRAPGRRPLLLSIRSGKRRACASREGSRQRRRRRDSPLPLERLSPKVSSELPARPRVSGLATCVTRPVSDAETCLRARACARGWVAARRRGAVARGGRVDVVTVIAVRRRALAATS